MGVVGRRDQLCYSARLMMPFVRVLAAIPQIPREWLHTLQAVGQDDRVPIATAHEMLALAVSISGEPLLPLKAGFATERGDAGALDYVMGSSATVQDAFDAAGRYARLVNEAMETSLIVEGAHACVKLTSSVPTPTEIEDFTLSSFLTNCVRPVLGDLHGLEVCFRRERPTQHDAYVKAFAPATLRFGAGWCGFRFPAARLSQPVPTADPSLNHILRAHLERTLAERPNAQSLLERTRHLIRRELPRGRATAPLVARELGMSRRTLCRRLEEEHTTFTDVLDEVRKQLAQEHVAHGAMSLSEIAFLLGFAQTAGFHRAFKRWTGTTPNEFRQRHR